jgi:hypothetical protein
MHLVNPYENECLNLYTRLKLVLRPVPNAEKSFGPARIEHPCSICWQHCLIADQHICRRNARESGFRLTCVSAKLSNSGVFNRRWIYMKYFCSILAFLVSGYWTALAQTPGSGPNNPASKGTTLTGIVECGEGYTSHELYDMKINLEEVVRGEEAWKRIKAASATNKPADPGFDYLLAKVKFEYYARGTPGLCIHQLSPDQFMAYSSNGEDYRNPSVVSPKPEMRKGLKSGGTYEGWVVFLIPQQDKNPIMSYSADTGGAVTHGGEKWFLLK